MYRDSAMIFFSALLSLCFWTTPVASAGSFTAQGLGNNITTRAMYDGQTGPLSGRIDNYLAFILRCSGCPNNPDPTRGGLAFGPGNPPIQFTTGSATGTAPDGAGVLFGAGGSIVLSNFENDNFPLPSIPSLTLFQGTVTSAEVFFGTNVHVTVNVAGSIDPRMLTLFGVSPDTPFVGALSFTVNDNCGALPPTACFSTVPTGGYQGGALNIQSGGTFSSNTFSLSFQSVPEPSGWILLASGFVGILAWRRESQRNPR